MFIANMASETMDWVALAETEYEAKELIREKWNQNQQRLVQCGWKNEPDYYLNVDRLEEDYNIDITEISVGECVTF